MDRQKEYWLVFYLVLGILHKSVFNGIAYKQGNNTQKATTDVMLLHII